MQKRQGFTLVELLVALAIIVLLLGVALSTNKGAARQQTLAGSAQKLIGCIEKARQEAAAPGIYSVQGAVAAVRYTAVTMKNTGQGVDCSYALYRVSDVTLPISPNAQPDPAKALNTPSSTSITVPTIQLSSISYSGSVPTVGSLSPVTIYFGVLEEGAPQVVCFTNASTPACNPSASAESGAGFPINIGVADSSSAASAISGTIQMSTLGNLIQYQAQ